MRTSKSLLALVLILLAAIMLTLAPAGRVRAAGATVTVTTLNDEDVDDSTCSLREAVMAVGFNADYHGCTGSDYSADDPDTINFNIPGGAGGTIQVTSTHAFRLFGPTIITNAGGPPITIRGRESGGFDSIFSLDAGATSVTLDSLNITHAQLLNGAVMVISGQAVTVINSTFSDNHAGLGMVFSNSGVLTVINSTFYGNVGNTAFDGGTIYNQGLAYIINSTFSNNKADPQTGVADILNSGQGQLHLANTILANSDGGPQCHNDDDATVVADGPNLIEDESCLLDGATHIITADPLLGAFDYHDGNTRTMLLGTGSPAVDAGDDSAIDGYTTDQNGDDRIQGAFVDLGAVESDQTDTDKPTALPFTFDDIFNSAPGGATYSFTIQYSDDVAIDVSTLGTGDITVTGPNSFSQVATYDGLNTSGNGTPRVATYHISTPGGSWDEPENGDYYFHVNAGEVKDTPGNAVDEGDIGSFNVLIDTSGPVGTLVSHPDVTTSGGTTYTFTVQYTDSSLVKVGTLGDDDITVTGPGAFSQAAKFDSVDPSGDGKPRTATYHITPPGGAWNEADNGAYTISLNADTVKDFYDMGNAAANLGGFTVSIKPEINVTDGTNTIDDGSSFEFPATGVGAPVQQTFTIENSGTGILNVSSLSLPSGFSLIGSFPTTVAANNGTATFKVQCDAAAQGSYTGDLSFTTDDDDENPYNFGLTCSVLVPEINVTDGTNTIDDGGSFVFPATLLGAPTQQTFTIENSGSVVLNVSALTLPTGFSLIGDFPTTVAASGGTATFTVQCDAASEASFTGDLSFTDDDTDENPYNFGLTCAVGVPELTVLRHSEIVNNGDHFEFQPGEKITFTVRNDGSHDLTLSPVDLAADFFTLTQDIGDTTLAPTETTSFTIACDDDVEDEDTAQARFANSDADENPFVIDLRCAPHHDKSPGEPTPPPPPLETFLCTNMATLTGGAIKVGEGKATLNGVTGDIFCNLLAKDGALNNSGAGIGDPRVLALGVIQAVDVYGLLPGGYSTDSFAGTVTVCLRGHSGVLFLHYNPATQQRELNWLPAVQDGEYTCVQVPSAGIVALVSGGDAPPPVPAAEAAPTEPPSSSLTDCSVTTLYAARLRAEPNTDSDILALVPYNLALEATEKTADGWYRVVFSNVQGWIRNDLLSTAGNCG